MSDLATSEAILSAVNRYFDLMYDVDLSQFDRVFAPSAQLHGVDEGQLRLLTADTYRQLLTSRPSPSSKTAPRLQELLLLDIASPSQAMAKVRVRINEVLFVDYLSLHLIDENWLVTAKSFHVEHRYPLEGN